MSDDVQQACQCDMRTRLVGDGCEVCNPQLADELAKEQIERLTAERDEARAEREVLRTLLIRARDMLDWVGGSCEGIDKTVQMVEAFQAEIDAQIEQEKANGSR